MPRRCVFCGNSPVTREHIIGQWVGRGVQVPGRVFIMHSEHGATGSPPESNRWASRGVDLVNKKVCKDCNTGWMSKLERAAKPLLAPMIQGRQTELTPEGQVVLARWVVKTATMVEYLLPLPYRADPGLLAWLSNGEGSPPSKWVLLAARRQGGSFIECDHKDLNLRPPRPSGEDFGGALVTVTIGHLVVQAFKPPAGWEGDIRVPDPTRDFLIQILPYGRLIRLWPPPAILSQEDLSEFRQDLPPPIPAVPPSRG